MRKRVGLSKTSLSQRHKGTKEIFLILEDSSKIHEPTEGILEPRRSERLSEAEESNIRDIIRCRYVSLVNELVANIAQSDLNIPA